MDTELTEEQYQRMVYTVGDIDKTIHFMRQMEESCYLKCAIQEHPTHSIIDDNCVDRCIFKYKQAEAIVDSVLKYESQKKETNN